MQLFANRVEISIRDKHSYLVLFSFHYICSIWIHHLYYFIDAYKLDFISPFQVADNLINCYGTSKCWYKYPGTIDLLDFLQKKNVILGIISNFDQRLESILEDVQIRQYFTFVLTSYDFGTEKPSLSIFEEALRLVRSLREETILPQEAMHIGDRVDNDYFGAKSAGWNALLIKHEDEISESKVPREDVFKNLKELQRHFDGMLGKTNYIT